MARIVRCCGCCNCCNTAGGRGGSDYSVKHQTLTKKDLRSNVSPGPVVRIHRGPTTCFDLIVRPREGTHQSGCLTLNFTCGCQGLGIPALQRAVRPAPAPNAMPGCRATRSTVKKSVSYRKRSVVATQGIRVWKSGVVPNAEQLPLNP